MEPIARAIPIEIWAHIASFGGDVLARLLFVIKGLNDYLRKYHMLEDSPLIQSFVHTVYFYEFRLKTVQMITGSPGKRWVKHGRDHWGVNYRFGKEHGELRIGDTKRIWDNGRLIYEQSQDVKTPEGILMEGRFYPVGKRIFFDTHWSDVCPTDGVVRLAPTYYGRVIWGKSPEMRIYRDGFIFTFRKGMHSVDISPARISRHFNTFSIEFERGTVMFDAEKFHVKTVHTYRTKESPRLNLRVVGTNGELLVCRVRDNETNAFYKDGRHTIHIREAYGDNASAETYKLFMNSVSYTIVRSGSEDYFRDRDGDLFRSRKAPGSYISYTRNKGSELIINDTTHRILIEKNKTIITDNVMIHNRIRGIFKYDDREYGFIDGIKAYGPDEQRSVPDSIGSCDDAPHRH